jgi:protein TonB
MLYALPITNARLSPCHEDWARMTPTEQGRYCRSCNREVVDFTHATAADLAQAQAAAPDGRLCGRFRASQLASPRQPLRPRLRQFLLAAVLILVQGLSARQAWAQAQQRPVAPFHPPTVAPLYQLPGSMPTPTTTPADSLSAAEHEQPADQEPTWVGLYVEQMPQPPGGVERLMKFFRKQARYPVEALRGGLAGKVFVGFTVTRTGQITGAHIIRGLDPALDAEALRLIRLMPAWTPGAQNGKPVDIQYVMPITFTRGAQKPPTKRRH